MTEKRTDIDPALVEAIAKRVVQLLGKAVPDGGGFRLVDAARLARELNVERDWVYAHADELGGIRLGGPRGRLRFDLDLVKERLARKNAGSRPDRRVPKRRRDPRKLTRIPLRPKVKSGVTAKVAGRRSNAPGPTPGGTPMQHNHSPVGKGRV